MRHLGRANNFSANLLAFAGVAAALLATACGDGATEPNRAPEAIGSVEDQAVDVGMSKRVNMSSYFSDPDGDVLTYTAESSNTAVATLSVSGSTVILTGASAPGSTTVTVTATDPGGLSASVTFSVTVTRFLGACAAGMELNPGDACSVGSPFNARFAVLANGSGSLGCCMTAGQGIHINQFSASRISGTDRWRINSVP